MLTYLLLNIVTLSGPLAFSFERRIAFWRRWGSVFGAIAFAGLLFILWDIAFTEMGVWGFNPDYLTGIWIFGLPLEEMLFFVTVPYACLFIYANVRHYFEAKLPNWIAPLGNVLAVGGAVLLFLQNPQGWYTQVCLGFALLLVLFQWLRRPVWAKSFWLAYALHLIPFFVVNGVLTALPVVWYNTAEFSAFRIGSVPAEDLYYTLSLFLLNVTAYEYIGARLTSRQPRWLSAQGAD